MKKTDGDTGGRELKVNELDTIMTHEDIVEVMEHLGIIRRSPWYRFKRFLRRLIFGTSEPIRDVQFFAVSLRKDIEPR